MDSEVVTNPVTVSSLLKASCLICGANFKHKRAGKMYCSNKCKQFRYYHKHALNTIEIGRPSPNSLKKEVEILEFQQYKALRAKVLEWNTLRKRSESKFGAFGMGDQMRMDTLEKYLPEYVRSARLPDFSIESWAFIKLRYKDLSKESFLKLVSSFDQSLFENMKIVGDASKNLRRNSISALYEQHIEDILNGNIIFS